MTTTNPKDIEALREKHPQAVAKWDAQRMMHAQRRERKRRREMVAEPILSEGASVRRLLPPKATIDDMLKAGREVLEREKKAK